jgi:hypothetical protein
MRTIGKITTLVALSALAVAAVVLYKSIPDLKRYARMRAM